MKQNRKNETGANMTQVTMLQGFQVFAKPEGYARFKTVQCSTALPPDRKAVCLNRSN